jgi:hypothetical protein
VGKPARLVLTARLNTPTITEDVATSWSIEMPSPFPGMDPYLENPEIFPDLHDSLITYLREQLQASLPAPYFAAMGRRIWIEFARRSIGPDVQVRRGSGSVGRRPEEGRVALAASPTARPVVVRVAHDEFREPSIEIYAQGGREKRLVTSIEVLSLTNKTFDERGRDLYKRKQDELLSSKVHLVEIDLLRGGEHTTSVPLDLAVEECGNFDYHVSVHRFDEMDTFFVYPIRLEELLPVITIPLLPGDPEVSIDLQAVFDRCHDAGPYTREIVHGEDAVVPALRPDQAAWAQQLVRAIQR